MSNKTKARTTVWMKYGKRETTSSLVTRRGETRKKRAKQEQIMLFVPHEKDIENLYNKAPLQTAVKSTSLRPVTLFFIPRKWPVKQGLHSRGRPRFHSRDRMTKSDPDRGQEGG